MNDPYRFEAISSLPHWQKVRGWISQVGGDMALSTKTTHTLLLLLEEWFVNLFTHGYGEKEGWMAIEIYQRDNHILLFLSDKAASFDPLQKQHPSLDAPLEERTPGGLGLFLLRSLSSLQEYRRDREKNILLLEIPL